MKPGGPHILPASGPFVGRRANESGCAAFRERHDETNGVSMDIPAQTSLHLLRKGRSTPTYIGKKASARGACFIELMRYSKLHIVSL
jgi:hypothetical protein